MRNAFTIVAIITALVAAGVSAGAEDKKAVTVSCLQVPELCKCQFLECLWSTTQVQPIPGNRVLYGAMGSTMRPSSTMRCADLSLEACKAANCLVCK